MYVGGILEYGKDDNDNDNVLGTLEYSVVDSDNDNVGGTLEYDENDNVGGTLEYGVDDNANDDDDDIDEYELGFGLPAREYDKALQVRIESGY